MNLLLQTLINGLLVGGIYALVAVGFSLVWGVMNVINLTHGAFVMLGAFTAYWLSVWIGLDPFLGAVVGMVLTFGIGYFLQKLLINRVVRAPIYMTLILTFGINLLIVNVALIVWSADFRSVTTTYTGQGLSIGSLVIPFSRAGTLLVAIVASIALLRFMGRTRTGNAILATRMDLEGAEGVGVRIDRIYAVTFAIGAALAGLAGGLISATQPISPGMGLSYLGTAFVATALGGLGSMVGALAGGLVLGVVETFGATLLGSGYQDVIGYTLLIVVLVLRPSGLVGKAYYR